MIEEKLKKLGLKLPSPPAPAGAYTPYVFADNLLFISGQLPWVEKKLKFTGKLGKELNLQQGKECAKICCLNALSVIKMALGDLNKIKVVVKVIGTVSSADNFYQQPLVVNGASELLLEVFGEKGKHSRAVSGVNVLPLNAPVMIEMVIDVQSTFT
jgi:enamine deaminase RidA (YjgF/YER057c/UK114 family)